MRLTDSYLGTLRARAGFTQLQVAQEVEVHQTMVSDWERGEYAPSTRQAETLAALYGTTLERVQVAARKDGLRYLKRLSRARRAG